MTEVPDHNAARWLIVSYAPPLAGHCIEPGWYVLRTCPCHRGHPVTRPLPDRQSAESARYSMLEVAS
jgi:hypothetical protein